MKAKKIIVDYLFITVGALFCAAAVNIFTSPNNIAPGGLTGVATILNYLIGVPIGITIFALNIPLFIWGYFENGRSFLTKTVAATALVSVFIDATASFFPCYKDDKLLASVFGGIIYGVGLALVFYRGSTTGGTDIVAKNLHNRFPNLSLGRLIIISDMFVVLLAIIVYRGLHMALYAIITIYAISVTTDKILYGFAKDNGKLLFIVTEKEDLVVPVIRDKIKRGLTIIKAEGGFAHQKKTLIFCAVRPRQALKLTDMIRDLDENSFVTVTNANNIRGLGFQNS